MQQQQQHLITICQPTQNNWKLTTIAAVAAAPPTPSVAPVAPAQAVRAAAKTAHYIDSKEESSTSVLCIEHWQMLKINFLWVVQVLRIWQKY